MSIIGRQERLGGAFYCTQDRRHSDDGVLSWCYRGGVSSVDHYVALGGIFTVGSGGAVVCSRWHRWRSSSLIVEPACCLCIIVGVGVYLEGARIVVCAGSGLYFGCGGACRGLCARVGWVLYWVLGGTDSVAGCGVVCYGFRKGALLQGCCGAVGVLVVRYVHTARHVQHILRS